VLSALSASLLFLVLAAPALAQFPWQAFRFLQPAGKIDPALVTECSGLVQSLRYGGIFWALGDSGNASAIVPVTAEGKLAPGWSGPVRVEGFKNYDWEDLALDGKGHLIIADVGNNRGRRKQLMLHFVDEPRPGTAAVWPALTVRVHYEDQREASPDYDCEAVFCAGDRVYFLTKHRSDKRTRLYRLEGDSSKKSNPLRLVDSFEIGGMVTAADVSPDGKLVAVLTYTSLWVFEFDPASGNIFRRGMRWTPVFAWQAEAAAFDGNNSVVIANESGQLYRVSVDSMEKVR
jgi:roadblock/LC7 domain-containing protein